MTYLKNNFGIDIKKEEQEVIKLIKNTNNKPLVYIYNTHEAEDYQALENNLYSFTPTVKTADYILKDLLDDKKISVLIEERPINKVLKKRGWDYSYSYRISREYMEDIKKNNESLKIFIDLHRDSGPNKAASTIEINKKKYAKIMFLVGKNRKNYETNIKIVKKLEQNLEKKYKGITRSTYYQKNYDYNQDFSDLTFLIELGTNHNTIDEVYNSLTALADIIYDYIESENL